VPSQPHVIESELLGRCRWFIHLRWVAAAVLAGLLLVNEAWLRLQEQTLPLWGVAAAIVLYNLAFSHYMRRRLNFCLIRPAPEIRRRIAGCAAAQMALDLLALTVLLRYSGGVENPLAFFYVFHMILASILLARRTSYLFAVLAVGMFSLVAVSDMAGLVPHYGFLSGWLESPGLYRSPLFVACHLAIFASAILASVYLTSSVAANLRERDAQLIRLSEDLRRANARLQELERRKSRFMLVAAHQIKSPLSAIVNLLQVAGRGPAGPEKRPDLLDRALARAEAAVQQVNELLYLARLREVLPERQQWQVMDFREVVEAVKGAVAAQAAARNQRLEVDLPDSAARVEGNTQELFDAVLNLVDNAIKYTDPGGTIRVRLRKADRGWELAVQDTGCGIPRAEMPNLFQEFFRASNAVRRKVAGTGLGLAIVKQIAEMHNGRVEVESTEGEGSTFRVWFPAAP